MGRGGTRRGENTVTDATVERGGTKYGENIVTVTHNGTCWKHGDGTAQVSRLKYNKLNNLQNGFTQNVTQADRCHIVQALATHHLLVVRGEPQFQTTKKYKWMVKKSYQLKYFS